ncbi:hypothetical protein AFL01nite_10170 [Aeromicrobium flavum]|uniref:Glycosyltransferase 2-like domain-containing protein n=1 Tax=Aeromicrobium flavum TaxID=416568 RepID=A0A512HTH0_9ACTN|nr:glycosyltransferase [Aeromicrobium flavum]GEO88690.1 hypothetical protein AFL01nite_10170 [Aeromicrobium flavum]
MDGRTLGVSVVIPTHRGVSRIASMLDALAKQSLDPASYEVIVVENGSDDGTRWIVESMARTHPERVFRYVHLPDADKASASNHGIAEAAYSHLTFVDDDDTVPPRYLEALWEQRQEGAIVVGYVADLQGADAVPSFDTYVVRALLPWAGRRVSVDDATTAVAFNVAKLVPTEVACRHRFDEGLLSGDDVVFWAGLTIAEGLEVVVAPPDTGAIYYRTLRPGSHSRPRERDFRWGIEAKLAVIARLAVWARLKGDSPGSRAAKRLVTAQTEHMNHFLKARPRYQDEAVAAIEAAGLEDVIHWSFFTRGRARRLVVSYCFPPTADSSAIVAARRVVAHGECVDVVSHAMGRLRGKDSSVRRLTRPYVARQWVLSGPTATLSWSGGVRDFVEKGWARVEAENKDDWPYESIYSRAMWPASHLLAAHVALQRPGTRWTAEMSDPLSINTEGGEKEGDWDPDDTLPLAFRKAVADRGFEGPEGPRLAPWIEAVTYALADEIIFTNRIQRDLMLDRIADPRLRERARSVAVVSAHPTPPERLFHAEAPIPLPQDVVNIGYFGNFYANRGIADLLTALQQHERRDEVRLHVFTDRPGPLMDQVDALGLEGHVEVHQQLPYLDYLAQTRRFDVLLVNDTAATAHFGVNPYLPSKLSDYLGSGTDIWAMVEPQSPLSEVEVAFVSAVGDVAEAGAVLDEIVDIHG